MRKIIAIFIWKLLPFIKDGLFEFFESRIKSAVKKNNISENAADDLVSNYQDELEEIFKHIESVKYHILNGIKNKR